MLKGVNWGRIGIIIIIIINNAHFWRGERRLRIRTCVLNKINFGINIKNHEYNNLDLCREIIIAAALPHFLFSPVTSQSKSCSKRCCYMYCYENIKSLQTQLLKHWNRSDRGYSVSSEMDVKCISIISGSVLCNITVYHYWLQAAGTLSLSQLCSNCSPALALVSLIADF